MQQTLPASLNIEEQPPAVLFPEMQVTNYDRIIKHISTSDVSYASSVDLGTEMFMQGQAHYAEF